MRHLISLSAVALFACGCERPAPEAVVNVPPLLARLDAIGVMQSSVTGLLLSAIHPKNLILNAAGAAAIDASGLDSGAQYIALVIFALIASVGMTLPIAAYFIARRKVGAMLGRWKDWLIRNNVQVMVALLLILGALLIARGLHILLA